MFSNVPRISSDGKVKCKAIPIPSIPSTHTDIKPLPRLYQSLANIVLPSPHLQNYTTMPPKRTAEDMGSSDEHHMSPSSRPRIENSDDSRGSHALPRRHKYVIRNTSSISDGQAVSFIFQWILVVMTLMSMAHEIRCLWWPPHGAVLFCYSVASAHNGQKYHDR